MEEAGIAGWPRIPPRGYDTPFRDGLTNGRPLPAAMIDPIRQQVLSAAELIVVKVGTRVLTGPDGLLDTARIESLGRQIDAVSANGRRVVLVSSGAVGAGMGRIGLTRRPTELARLQAVAAIG